MHAKKSGLQDQLDNLAAGEARRRNSKGKIKAVTTSKFPPAILVRIAKRERKRLSDKAITYLNSIMNEINTGYQKKDKMGRPRSSYSGEARDQVYQLRLTKGEKELLRDNSDQIGIGIADYLRLSVYNLEKTLAEQEEGAER